jgi:NTE family protein
MKWNIFNTTVGVALGGGGARGIAHIGVLKALEENNIEISYISGTSIGALVASYYAFGKNINDIKEIGKNLNFTAIIGFSIHKKGLFSTKSIESMILDDLGDVNIEDAMIPLAICTTDIATGKQVILTRGNLAKAVCASTAIPGIFIPIEIENHTLIDGGISENVPISLLDKMGAGITVGVSLNGNHSYPPPNDMITIMGNAMDIAIDLRTKDQLRKADFVIALNLEKYSRLDNSEEFEELYNEGYLHTKEKINKLFWYKKIRLAFYLKKLYMEIMPFKLPSMLTWWKEKT